MPRLEVPVRENLPRNEAVGASWVGETNGLEVRASSLTVHVSNGEGLCPVPTLYAM